MKATFLGNGSPYVFLHPTSSKHYRICFMYGSRVICPAEISDNSCFSQPAESAESAEFLFPAESSLGTQVPENDTCQDCLGGGSSTLRKAQPLERFGH